MRLFVLLRLGTLDLCRAAQSLLSVLALLACEFVSAMFTMHLTQIIISIVHVANRRDKHKGLTHAGTKTQ